MSNLSNLPPGMTMEMMRAALAFLASQTIPVTRPSGLLQPNQIRGVDPNRKYTFIEYPKALTPPDVEIKSMQEERQLRVKWQQPLPYNVNDPQGKEFIDEYYATQTYPKLATPPQIIVHSSDEEAAIRASWNMDGQEVQLFPMWMFHASKPSVLVNNAKQLEQLGEGWFRTPQEAIDSAKGQKPVVQASEEIRRAEIIKRADELGVAYDRRQTTDAIARAVEKAETKKDRAA